MADADRWNVSCELNAASSPTRSPMTRMRLVFLLLAVFVLPRQAAADPIEYRFNIDFQLVYGPDTLGLDNATVELVALLNDPPTLWSGANDWLINRGTLTLTGTNG